ncbi:15724_t:CDS:1, partial [Acaulospora colombiana]
KLEPLTTNNFAEWRWRIDRVLEAGGAYEPLFDVDPDTNKPWTRPYDDIEDATQLSEEQKAERESWDRCMRTAAHWISTAAGRQNHGITEAFLTKRDPKGMLEALKDNYAPRHMGALFQAMCNLFEVEQLEGETWDKFIYCIDSLGMRMTDLIPEHCTISDIVKLLKAYNIAKNVPGGHILRSKIISNPEFNYDQVVHSARNLTPPPPNRSSLPTIDTLTFMANE